MYYVRAIKYSKNGYELSWVLGKRWFSWTAKRLVRKHLKDDVDYIKTTKTGYNGVWAIDAVKRYIYYHVIGIGWRVRTINMHPGSCAEFPNFAETRMANGKQ